MTDALDDILPAADVDARNPSPRILALAIANMQPGADRAPVRLTSDLQFQSCVTAVQNAFADTARHRWKTPVLSNVVQYTGRNRGEQPRPEIYTIGLFQGFRETGMNGGEHHLRNCKVETWAGSFGNPRPNQRDASASGAPKRSRAGLVWAASAWAALSLREADELEAPRPKTSGPENRAAWS